VISEIELRENYEKVLKNVELHAKKVSRKPEEIKLVAVTKTQPIDVLKLALHVGINILGENYAQELRDKSKALSDFNIEWHFIGRIQTNKLKYIVPVANLIHSVYRLEEISEIDKIAKKVGKIQNVLLEVNVSGEESKGGVKLEDVREIIVKSQEFSNVRIIGLMTMAPYIEPEETRKYFRFLREARDYLNKEFPNVVELSMGMSNDYTVAIEEGSTILRIGTAIFGERLKIKG